MVSIYQKLNFLIQCPTFHAGLSRIVCTCTPRESTPFFIIASPPQSFENFPVLIWAWRPFGSGVEFSKNRKNLPRGMLLCTSRKFSESWPWKILNYFDYKQTNRMKINERMTHILFYWYRFTVAKKSVV